ncbi:Vegetative incompatibility protein HET-E-1 [Fulvia fulva]|uniref:Vegetative incompatibility protein HET-E-1 n=1 Tax=Passalora fulva TaxID=5499 RepID=A0A9Q8LHG3_PASFU|nr:Vegetative incompatibility protein HET-E-1 [Fulvia fulva]KAK4625419.1 Vegetative incompatibility protein HET-E-1 [Fulvia fulva]UJO17706.1 Vegetative incompatibility protein HET-E-1 [Fulvia fulva]
MRLLHVAALLESGRLELEEFIGSDVPSYAILSHTWGHDEVLYSDIASGRAHTEHVWIDTCCINKSSSAELQEAINSMYRAETCYVYLKDVNTPTHVDFDIFRCQFRSSRWFSRGWTLQESLVPRSVQFFVSSGKPLWPFSTTSAHDDRRSLVAEITSATNFAEDIIAAGPGVIHERSIATRMSWAATRITTREEDIAYSLLGIFNVNMPLLYGEGRKAFRRLQQTLLDQSDDSSIFCWTSSAREERAGRIQLSGLLADEPSHFSSIAPTIMAARPQNCAQAQPYSMTNKGLQITLPLIQFSRNIYLGLLDCRLVGRGGATHRAAIYIIRLLSGTNQFARLLPDMVVPASAAIDTSSLKVETILVRQGSGPRVHSLTQEDLPSFFTGNARS